MIHSYNTYNTYNTTPLRELETIFFLSIRIEHMYHTHLLLLAIPITLVNSHNIISITFICTRDCKHHVKLITIPYA